MESGNLTIIQGVIEILAEDNGILIQSGSITTQGAILTIQNSRLTGSGCGCGIVIINGDLNLSGLITVTGEGYGIVNPDGDITIHVGKVKTSGSKSGITGKNLAIKMNASLIAYGKSEGAVVLSETGPWKDPGIIVWAGTSEKTATEDEYSGQKFVHVSSVSLPEQT
jgi:hypothetical protein